MLRLKNKEDMKILLNIVLLFLLFINASFIVKNDADSFIQGAWVSEESSMKRITFMKNDMVQVLSDSSGEDVSIQVHYEVIGINKEKKEIAIQFLRKNLFQDKFDPIKSINFQYKNNDHLAVLAENGDTINFYRDKTLNEHSYR